MEFDPKFWLDLIQFGLTGIIGIYLYTERRRDKTSSRIDALEEKFNTELKDINRQLSDMEGRLRQAIGHSELEPLHRRLNGVDAKLGELNGKMHTLDLIHEFLMKGGK